MSGHKQPAVVKQTREVASLVYPVARVVAIHWLPCVLTGLFYTVGDPTGSKRKDDWGDTSCSCWNWKEAADCTYRPSSLTLTRGNSDWGYSGDGPCPQSYNASSHQPADSDPEGTQGAARCRQADDSYPKVGGTLHRAVQASCDLWTVSDKVAACTVHLFLTRRHHEARFMIT